MGHIDLTVTAPCFNQGNYLLLVRSCEDMLKMIPKAFVPLTNKQSNVSYQTANHFAALRESLECDVIIPLHYYARALLALKEVFEMLYSKQRYYFIEIIHKQLNVVPGAVISKLQFPPS